MPGRGRTVTERLQVWYTHRIVPASFFKSQRHEWIARTVYAGQLYWTSEHPTRDLAKETLLKRIRVEAEETDWETEEVLLKVSKRHGEA